MDKTGWQEMFNADEDALWEAFQSPEERKLILKTCTSPDDLYDLLEAVTDGVECESDNPYGAWLQVLGWTYEYIGPGSTPYTMYSDCEKYVSPEGIEINFDFDDGNRLMTLPDEKEKPFDVDDLAKYLYNKYCV